MSPIPLRDAIARLVAPDAELRPLICYGYPQAADDTRLACASLASAMGLSYREVRAPLADASWPPNEMTLALVDCSAAAPELSIDRWSRWLSRCDTDCGARALAFFFQSEALDERGKDHAAALAFKSSMPCVFVSSAPTLCDLFSALRTELPPHALARVDFSAPQGSEAWSELVRLGTALATVESRWASTKKTHEIRMSPSQPDPVLASPCPPRGLAALFESLRFGR